MINHSDRLGRLPPYVFADLEKMEREMIRRGGDLISLGIGDPDLPTPKIIVETMRRALAEPGSSNYSSSVGEPYLREAIAEWYDRRFKVKLDPDKEVCPLIGSKEGLANIGRVLLNDGDRAIIPDPAYPVYAQGATILADAAPTTFRLHPRNGFQPNLTEVAVDKGFKLLFLNYPNNPTGAVATPKTLEEAVELCRKHNLVLCYDNAYSEVTFEDYVSPSPLQLDGASECTVEFNSCSKTFNMTGYRVGFAVGNRKVIEGLKKLKAQIDSGIPKFIQKAAAMALTKYFDPDLHDEIKSNNRILRDRLVTLANGLRDIGLKAEVPKATFYIWVNVNTDGTEFVKQLLDVGVGATPGVGFGETGRQYIRFSVTEPRIDEAVERIQKIKARIA